MTEFDRFMIGLDWGETLIEQRERMAKKILSPEQYEKRCAVMVEPKIVTQKQLRLFE